MILLAAGLALATPLLAPGFVSPAAAHDASVQVSHAWARATAASAMTGGAFLTLTAQGHPDALVGASTPVAKTAELHETVNDKGVMKMLPVPKLALQPGTPVTFAPGGYHLMLMGLQHPLKRGESFPLTLRFEHAPPQTVSVTIEGPGAMMDMHHK
jgi:copper(I)-binding protein